MESRKMTMVLVKQERTVKADTCPDYLGIDRMDGSLEARVDSIMTAHVAVPRLTKGAKTSATLSHEILTGVLKNPLGFRGIPNSHRNIVRKLASSKKPVVLVCIESPYLLRI